MNYDNKYVIWYIVCLLQLRVSGESEGAILEGVEDDKEYQISLSALYGDGAQSEAVAIRYSTCESHTHTNTLNYSVNHTPHAF